MFVGVYWSDRKESRTAVASRLVMFLKEIGKNEGFAKWYEADGSHAPFSIDVVTIAEGLEMNHDDADGICISELGYDLWLSTSGSPDGGALLSAHVGSHSAGDWNSVLLRLGSTPITKDVGRDLLQCMIRAFDPDQGAVTSNQILDQAGAEDPLDAGWFIYRRGKGISAG